MPREIGNILARQPSPGQIYQTSQYVIDFWRSLGVLKADITPADSDFALLPLARVAGCRRVSALIRVSYAEK